MRLESKRTCDITFINTRCYWWAFSLLLCALSGCYAETSWQANDTGSPPEVKSKSLQFVEAAHTGDLLKIKELWKGGIDVNARAGAYSSVFALPGQGAPGEVPNWTAMHASARMGNAEVLTFLISAGAGLDLSDNLGRTPLHLATDSDKQGATECVQRLLAAGANCRCGTRSTLDGPGGVTPLHNACFHRNARMVEVLLSRNADARAKNSFGDTPLHYLYLLGSDDLISQQLLNHGASLDDVDMNGRRPIDMLELARLDNKEVGTDQPTPPKNE